MSKRFWLFIFAVQLAIVLTFAFSAGVTIGVVLLLTSAVGDVLVALLLLARKQWRQLAGLEEIERREK